MPQNLKQARRTEIKINYQGKDISKDLAPYLVSFTFTDNSKDKADDISITLQDASGEWLRDWTPAKSDTITASIIKYDDNDTRSLPCGTFTVDQVDYSMPPRILSIKAISSAVKGKAAQTKKTRTWEKLTLASVLGQIASDNGLGLMLDGDASYFIERLEQTEQSDLDFLKELCTDYGLAVKIQTGQIVIYDKDAYEGKGSACEIWSDDDRLISARFSSKAANIYKSAKLTYHHPYKDEDYTGTYTDDSQEGSGKELIIHERAETQGDATRIAKQRLLEANRKEITGSIIITGDVRLAAGVTVQLGGFGMFSGKHFVNKCTHKVDGSGFTTTLELGQPKAEKGKGNDRKAKRQGKSKKGGTKSRGTGEIFYTGERYYQ